MTMQERDSSPSIVLIVDDRPAILDFARATLEAQGMSVLTANKLDTAVAICDEDDVHVVLIEYRLCPKGGEHAVQALRYTNPLTQVILHGGYDETSESSQPGIVEGPDSLLQWVEVGLATYRRNAASRSSSQVQASDETATILFVGERDVYPWLTSWLESAGCRVLISPNPTDALDHYIRERAQVVILPQNLTAKETGDLVRRIRVLDPSVPVVVLCEEDLEIRRGIADSMQPHAICDGNDSERVSEAIESALNASWRMDQARADQDLRGLLLAKFSDDVRNAILAIQGYAEILRDDSQPQVRRAVDGLSDAAGAALKLVQKYLDLARLDAPNMVVRRERVAVDQIIKDLMTTDRRDQRRPLTLATKVDLSDRSLYTDGEKLSAALAQLLDNFAQSSVSGRVELDIKEAPQAAEFILRSPNCEVGEPDPRPQSASDGGGSPSADLPDDGLGLAIAQRLTDLLGGSLSINRGSNGEAVVRLSIPRSRQPTPSENEMLH
jgi:signal transduction histidine kinase